MTTTSRLWIKAEACLVKDKHIEPLVKKWGSCTIKSISTSKYFETLVDAICSQQLSGRAAATIFNRVKQELDGNITPSAILLKDDQKLRDCGLSWAKVKYIKDLADKTKQGKLDVGGLNKLNDEEIISQLVQVKGVGRWTAEMFLMFSLARPDIFPVDDLGIKKGYEKVTGKKWDKERSFQYAQNNWKPYRTVASWYLWKSLE